MLWLHRREKSGEHAWCNVTNRMWFSVVCTLIDNEYASSQWSKCCGLTRRSLVSPQQILTTVMTRIVVDKSTDNAKPYSICFFTTISTSKKVLFLRARGQARAENDITWHIDVCSPVCTLIDNGNLANQIARLVAIVVKKELEQKIMNWHLNDKTHWGVGHWESWWVDRRRLFKDTPANGSFQEFVFPRESEKRKAFILLRKLFHCVTL